MTNNKKETYEQKRERIQREKEKQAKLQKELEQQKILDSIREKEQRIQANKNKRYIRKGIDRIHKRILDEMLTNNEPITNYYRYMHKELNPKETYTDNLELCQIICIIVFISCIASHSFYPAIISICIYFIWNVLKELIINPISSFYKQRKQNIHDVLSYEFHNRIGIFEEIPPID